MVLTTIPKALANAEAVVDIVMESEELLLLLKSNCCWARADVVEVDLKNENQKLVMDF